MRESFGGAFMIKLVLVFIVIYITFMGVAIEYAKVFRVKNQVINMLEQSQYKIGDTSVEDKIDTYLSSVPYNRAGTIGVENKCNNSITENNSYKYITRGVCIEQFVDDNAVNAHFKVTVYISIDFPFFGINMTLPISGETKTIRY